MTIEKKPLRKERPSREEELINKSREQAKHPERIKLQMSGRLDFGIKKDPNFHYCIANDTLDNIDKLIEQGYELVIKDGHSVRKPVKRDGTFGYLLRIPRELHNKIRELENAKADNIEQGIRTQADTKEYDKTLIK